MIYIFIGILIIINFSLIIYIMMQRKNIINLTKDIKDFLYNRAAQRHVQLSLSCKALEKLTVQINKFIDIYFDDIYQQKQQQESVKKEITNISHDLRTPLTSILGYNELLNNNDLTDEESKEYIKIISNKGKLLQNRIEELYEFSRLNDNEIHMNLERLDFNYILNEHILNFYNDFINKGIELEINKPDTPIYIIADKKFIERILTNLISNTLKYSTKMLYIDVKQINHRLVVSHKNENSSLTDYDVNHLFDRFYIKDETRGSNSTGLGLSITQILVNKMNGDIKAYIDNNLLVIEFSLPISEF